MHRYSKHESAMLAIGWWQDSNRNDIISLKKSPDEKLDDKISGLL